MPDQEGRSLSPSTPPQSRRPEYILLWTTILTLIAFSVFLSGIFLAPWLESRSSIWASFVYAVYSPFCHQLPERSLICFGHPLAVCSRCLGIYLGIFGGLLFYPFTWKRRPLIIPGRKVFLLFSVPIALDTAANLVKLWSSSNSLRLFTGLLWGGLLPFYFIAGIVDFLKQRQRRRTGRANKST